MLTCPSIITGIPATFSLRNSVEKIILNWMASYGSGGKKWKNLAVLVLRLQNWNISKVKIKYCFKGQVQLCINYFIYICLKHVYAAFLPSLGSPGWKTIFKILIIKTIK